MANVTNKTNRSTAEEDLAEALHQIYGSDLNAFFADVQRRLGIERSVKSEVDTRVKPRPKRR